MKLVRAKMIITFADSNTFVVVFLSWFWMDEPFNGLIGTVELLTIVSDSIDNRSFNNSLKIFDKKPTVICHDYILSNLVIQ